MEWQTLPAITRQDTSLDDITSREVHMSLTDGTARWPWD